MAENQASVEQYRQQDGADRALILVHGFNGGHEDWGEFPAYLTSDDPLSPWDIYSIGYTTSSKIDLFTVANFLSPHQSRDPELRELATYLRTRLYVRPLDRYQRIAFVAHSMGGLVVQRAIVDDDELRAKVSDLVLFGTPSGGLQKAGLFGRLKRQMANFMVGSEFIADLRERWTSEVTSEPEFSFRAVAGDSDQFVPPSTVLEPFQVRYHASVPGDHLTMIQPDAVDDLNVLLVSKLVGEAGAPAGPFDAARLAMTIGDYARAVEEFSARAGELDDRHAVLYAMALEAVGRREEAIKLLQGRGGDTDVRGTLAGRLKRQWLDNGDEAVAARALEIYSSAYTDAVAAGDPEQALYLGINVAFMQLAAEERPDAAQATAVEVLRDADDAPPNYWTLATQGEAYLHLGRTDRALESFDAAMRQGPGQWQATSTFDQVSAVAELRGQDDAIEAIGSALRPSLTEI
jgi:pimeloyl-ACP methyl ester carboxylesterase